MPIPAMIATTPNTPITTPTMAPELSPWFLFFSEVPAGAVGVTVTVSKLIDPLAVMVLTEVLGVGVVVVLVGFELVV
jgi:hypothetical protein